MKPVCYYRRKFLVPSLGQQWPQPCSMCLRDDSTSPLSRLLFLRGESHSALLGLNRLQLWNSRFSSCSSLSQEGQHGDAVWMWGRPWRIARERNAMVVNGIELRRLGHKGVEVSGLLRRVKAREKRGRFWRRGTVKRWLCDGRTSRVAVFWRGVAVMM